MASNSKKETKNEIARSYLNKDRDAFKAMLLQHAKIFYQDKIKDFSEASVGGLFLDLAAAIGDNMSFYLDHQFTELDAELAVESKNIQRHIRAAGVKITGASPATVAVPWVIEVPAERIGSTYQPQESALPIINEGSICTSNEGVEFELVDTLDYRSRDEDGNLKCIITVGESNSDGSPSTYLLMLGGSGNYPKSPDGICVSGFKVSESFTIPNVFEQFREITLSNENVTEILSVVDSDGNVYYEVESLTHDTVFKGIENLNDDNELVAENLELIPAPYRFVRITDIDTGLTTLRFGSGNAATLDDDIIPDPSELALPLYGKQTFSRYALDPNRLLATQTLGISPINTTITVIYRYGGGLSHNASANTIRTITRLLMSFPGAPDSTIAAQVRSSVSINNPAQASGGDDALTLDEIRDKIPAARNSQERIVSKQDLLARVYTMPSSFGRVFRAGVRSNPVNPLATQLYIVSRDSNGNLIISPDTLKKNLRVFLNQYRMISDAIDILDARVINLAIEFKVVVETTAIKNIVLQTIIKKLKNYFNIRNFYIDQPIKIDDVRNIIFNTQGVSSLIDVRYRNINQNIGTREYSNVKFDVQSNIRKQFLVGPPGSIFEVRHPDYDIIGTAF